MNITARPIGQLLQNAQACDPQDIVEAIAQTVVAFGGKDVVLFMVDYDHSQLRPHPDVLPHGERPQIVNIDGSMAGRAFTSGEALAVEQGSDWHCWIPVTERSERLGVLALTMPRWDDEMKNICVDIGIATAHIVTSASQYTDRLTVLRRRKDMELAAEIQWSLLPPLTFSRDGATVAGLLEPAYQVGGDCFDYSFNDEILDFAIFDAMGHGLSSAVLSTLAVAAYRSARRAEGHSDLVTIASFIDDAIESQHHGESFATAVIGKLDVNTGHLSWINAGHPNPLHLRNGRRIDLDVPPPGKPLGVGATFTPMASRVVFDVDLEPNDSILLYTDGVVEARSEDGTYFGEERLNDFLEREADSGEAAEEVLRRLVRAVLSHQHDRLKDDASMLYIKWAKLRS